MCFLFWLFAVIRMLAIVFGGASIRQTNAAGRPRNGMAMAGLTLGIVFTAIHSSSCQCAPPVFRSRALDQADVSDGASYVHRDDDAALAGGYPA